VVRVYNGSWFYNHVQCELCRSEQTTNNCNPSNGVFFCCDVSRCVKRTLRVIALVYFSSRTDDLESPS